MDRFLVQVNKDGGYANITNNRLYENGLWAKKPRDRDHGDVKSGDELLVYCTSTVPKHGASLAFSTVVKRVSPDKVTFELDEPQLFNSPLKRREIVALVGRGELPEVFLGCGQQGFNISKLDTSAAEYVLALTRPEQYYRLGQIYLEALANDLYLPTDFLQNIQSLLDDKLQVIFQGPPGTGKTYVAQKLANHLAGSPERVTLVQFHPSYAYEDFVQGFRPTQLENGQPGFKLADGPLLRAAERARKEPDQNHFLIIDEINRGQIAKVFGELYFLLEYREEKIRLQYQQEEEKFSLPSNLYVIGTMNTADRSIALVDLALRRRFYFVDFHPDDEPIKGVLRRWTEEKAPGMGWVAGVVERANELLQEDREAAIGPSYFMKEDLDEAIVERIWNHSVRPYIAELLHSQPDRLDEFNLDRLRGSSSGDGGDSDGQEAGNGEAGDIDG